MHTRVYTHPGTHTVMHTRVYTHPGTHTGKTTIFLVFFTHFGGFPPLFGPYRALRAINTLKYTNFRVFRPFWPLCPATGSLMAIFVIFGTENHENGWFSWFSDIFVIFVKTSLKIPNERVKTVKNGQKRSKNSGFTPCKTDYFISPVGSRRVSGGPEKGHFWQFCLSH